jgi:porin
MRKSYEIKTILISLTVLLSVSTIQYTTNALAEEASSDNLVENIWNSDQLTGDWWGGRSYLSRHGIDIGLRLSQYYQGVASGGVNRNSEYGGTLDYRVNLDAGKLVGAKGLSFNLHARTRYGKDINADAGALVLPNSGMMMPSPGDYHGTDVTGLTGTYMFPFFAERTGAITLGMLDAIDMITGFFPNIDGGQEGFWNVSAHSSNMPWFGAVQGLSLWGGMAVTIDPKYEIADNGFLFTGTKNESTSWGSISEAFDDGVWLAAFHRFLWKMDDKTGYFMVFGAASTKDQVSNDPLDFIEIPGQGVKSTAKKKPWDIALYLYQDIWQADGNPDRKANIFLGATVGPGNPQFAQWNFFANLETFGPMASRPLDRMGVVGWWNGLSSNFKELVYQEIELRDTWGFEFYYNFALNKWLHLSADLQLVNNENVGDNFAVIPGARLVIDF